MRIGINQDSKAITQLYNGEEVTILAKVTDRYKIRYNGQIGYVSADYITFDEVEGSGGTAVVEYAKQFLGNRYVYGGTSLTNGADCSGFVMSVYKNFGVSLPHSSYADRTQGYAVDGWKMHSRVIWYAIPVT